MEGNLCWVELLLLQACDQLDLPINVVRIVKWFPSDEVTDTERNFKADSVKVKFVTCIICVFLVEHINDRVVLWENSNATLDKEPQHEYCKNDGHNAPWDSLDGVNPICVHFEWLAESVALDWLF